MVWLCIVLTLSCIVMIHDVISCNDVVMYFVNTNSFYCLLIGLKTNCYKFITMVTGCSISTIARVEEQMRKTGGDREPPPHGLKKYWEQQPRAAKLTKKPTEPVVAPSISLATGQRNPLTQSLLNEVLFEAHDINIPL